MKGITINTITVDIKIKQGKREEFLQTIRLLHENMKNESGFLKLTLYQDTANPDMFYLKQEWDTQDDLDNQIRSEGFRVLLGALKVLSAEAEVRYHLGSRQTGATVYEFQIP